MQRPSNLTLAGILAIVFLTLASYGPALNGGFIWDDDDYVEENEVLDADDALARIWSPGDGERKQIATPQYYPVVFTSYWIENKLWGRGPGDTLGYHIVNVLLHAIGALLLWRLLRILNLRGAWFVAAVFALHPVNVESVAWITERKNVLSGVFYLGAFIAYLRFLGFPDREATAKIIDEPQPKKKQRKQAQAKPVAAPLSWPFYLIALVCFAGALLSKSVTASLPAAILLVLYWKRGRLTRNDVLLLIPFFVVGILAGNHTAEVERDHVFKLDVDLGIHGVEHVLVAGRAIWFYASKLLLPTNLTFMYPRWLLDAGSFVQWLYPITAIGTLLVAFILRGRIGRGPLVALLFFGGTLIPALGFVDVYPLFYAYVADHFQYLASLGILVLVGCGAARALADRIPTNAQRGLAAVVLGTLAALTWIQCHDYRDLRTLWIATLERNPGKMMVAINLSNMVVREDKDIAEANRILDEALAQVEPGIHPLMHARAHYNYGNNLGTLGEFEAAIEKYARALEIDPTYIKAYSGLGWAHDSLGNSERALEHYETHLKRLNALRLDDPRLRETIRRVRAKTN